MIFSKAFTVFIIIIAITAGKNSSVTEDVEIYGRLNCSREVSKTVTVNVTSIYTYNITGKANCSEDFHIYTNSNSSFVRGVNVTFTYQYNNQTKNKKINSTCIWTTAVRNSGEYSCNLKTVTLNGTESNNSLSHNETF